ncbi:hypothetical protein BV898_05543 [Hypsibius exemplaris]|uniref:G-protein coupled receptors family 1 profile domain-containing protein n=1 Tax=Hypsibius exemplaris TaxID=2072580 RepID=A0A1W0WZ69_HYPEX|nr:hypothetical protein BV898_05543 [Hypsibius exemplaris]
MNPSSNRDLRNCTWNNTTNSSLSEQTWRAGFNCNQDLTLTILPYLFCGLIIPAQFFNLVTLGLLPKKELYILYHISLSASSLLVGISLALKVLFNAFLPHQSVIYSWLLRISIGTYYYADCSALIATFLMSLDRWMFLGYPPFYRGWMTRQKVLLGIAGFVWLASLFLVAPGLAFFWEEISVSPDANRNPFHLEWNRIGTKFGVWFVAKGPFLLPFVLFCHQRVLVIATTHKWKLWRRRHRVRVPAPAGQGHIRAVFGIVWSSLAASMAIISVALAVNVPWTVFLFVDVPQNPLVFKAFGILSLAQHCYSPAVYLLCWKEYRAVLRRNYHRLVRTIRGS